MTHSIVSPSSGQPRNQEKFPLTRRGDGRWCKAIRDKIHYFTGSADEALAEWLRTKDDLLAGRSPAPKPDANAITVKYLCDAFLTAKEERLKVTRQPTM